MLNEEQRKVGRRNFLKAVAAAPAVGAFAWSAASTQKPLAAGIIGTGGEGGVLIEQTNPALMRYVAVCDIFQPNRKKGIEKIRKFNGTDPVEFEDYKKMLERDDIEAIVVATPLWLHAPMAIDALKAGKHVLSEKTMAYSVGDCERMIAAAKSAGKLLQIGHQRRYNELYHNAISMVKSGLIGDVYHVRAMWHRNNDWRRPVPKSDFDPRPHGYADLERLVNWRLYRKHSQGLMTELGSHQVDVVNWLTGGEPVAVQASGGLYRYKDGREMNDHVFCVFEYPNGLTLTYSSIQSNAQDNYYEQIMGTKGTVVLEGEGQAYLFTENVKEAGPGPTSAPASGSGAAKTASAAGAGATKGTEISVKSGEVGAPVMEASASRAADAAGGAAASQSAGTGGSLVPYHNELEGLVKSIRTGEPPLCTGAEGIKAARAVLAANEAVEKRTRIELAAVRGLT